MQKSSRIRDKNGLLPYRWPVQKAEVNNNNNQDDVSIPTAMAKPLR